MYGYIIDTHTKNEIITTIKFSRYFGESTITTLFSIKLTIK